MTSVAASNHVGRALLVDSIRRRKHDFRRLAAWSALEALPAFLSGLLVARALNSFLASDVASGLAWLGVFGCSVLVGVWGTRRTLRILAAVVEPFRDELVTGVVQGSVRRSTIPGTSPNTGDVAVLTEQVEIVREAYAAALMVLQQFLVVTGSAMIGLLVLAPVALVFVVPSLLVSLGIFVLSLGRMANAQRDSIMADERLAASATTLGEGLRDIVASGGEDQVVLENGKHIDEHARATIALGRLAAMGTLAIAIGSWLPLLLILGFGSRLVEAGASAGVIVGTATYVMQGLQPALQTLVHGLNGPGLWLMVTSRRVAGAMDTATADPRGGDAETVNRDNDVSLAHITFAYSEWAAPVIHELDLVVPPGDYLAVIGPSGAGKSTLAGLMSGLLTPQHGEARIGGVDLRRRGPRALAGLRVLIPQEAYVFAGTVRDNFEYLRDEVPISELDQAVDVLGARSLVERLGGYDAILHQEALSAGERQLVTLVRAYLSPAELVVLDEATCHLDPRAEAVVERAFAARRGSLVVIAHRMSSALRARRILVLDGATVMLGTSEELLVRSELYRDLMGHWMGERSAAAQTC
jgi:ABC-type multidrug transport system fused ATPase/permease subunit